MAPILLYSFSISPPCRAVFSTAEILGVDHQELAEWNGNKQGVIQAGNTIRIYEDANVDRPISQLVGEESLELFSAN